MKTDSYITARPSVPKVASWATQKRQYPCNKKILVVDDEPGITHLVKLVLPEFQILEENNPRCARETALEFKPDLILLDVMMPIMDGGDVAAQLERDTLLHRTPIVFLTGIVTPTEAGEEPKQIGGYPFINKPFSVAALKRCIQAYIQE